MSGTYPTPAAVLAALRANTSRLWRDRISEVSKAYGEAAKARAFYTASAPPPPPELATLTARAEALASERDETAARKLPSWDAEHASELAELGSSLAKIQSELASQSPAAAAAEADKAARALVADIAALADFADGIWPLEPAAADAAVLVAVERTGTVRERLLGESAAPTDHTAAARAALERCRG